MRRTVPALALCSLLGACASMNEDQCRRADWFDQGRSDGRAGQAGDRINAHREACSKAGVLPDGGRWSAGWREGVKLYCAPTSAWDAGVHDRSYNGVCRDLDEADFLRWYRAGKDVYRVRQERAKLTAEIDKAEEQLKKATKDDERKALRERIVQLDKDKARVRRTLETLESVAPR